MSHILQIAKLMVNTNAVRYEHHLHGVRIIAATVRGRVEHRGQRNDHHLFELTVMSLQILLKRPERANRKLSCFIINIVLLLISDNFRACTRIRIPLARRDMVKKLSSRPFEVI